MSGLERGRRLSARDLALLPLAAGAWLEASRLEAAPVLTAANLEEVMVGIYLVTDPLERVVWLGQARRDNGVAARLRDHLRVPSRAEAFAHVRVLHLDDFTPVAALNAAEGRAADLLRLRGTLGQRRWPSAARWAEFCSPAARQA